MHKTIMVTGASGFIGQVLCSRLVKDDFIVRGLVRNLNHIQLNTIPGNMVDYVSVDDIGPNTDWGSTLNNVDVVVHLAGCAHVISKSASSLADYHRVNVAGTDNLARMVASSTVSRLIYISSAKVNGERTTSDVFTESDIPKLSEPYSLSKWEAEQALHQIADKTGLEVVILRPPIVYGLGVKANFLRLIELVASGIPLPLAAVHNRRSLIYLGNLVDAIATCITHPQAAGKTFLVSDGEDVSTPELINRIAANLQCPSRLFPMPVSALQLLGKLSGKSSAVSRLTDSFVIDSSKIRRELGWSPPYSLDQGLAETLDWYKALVK